jgi:hypothetical protein
VQQQKSTMNVLNIGMSLLQFLSGTNVRGTYPKVANNMSTLTS